MKKILFLLLLILPCSAYADELDMRTQKEIRQLVILIRTSPCRFQRNGSWYSSTQAAEHINRKYRHVLAKGLIHSAEDFIRYAATKSSLTGRMYKIRCEGDDLTDSSRWLTGQLQRLRREN